MTEQYHTPRQAISDVKADASNRSHYEITGRVVRHTSRPDEFTCRVVHGEVVSLRVHPVDKPAVAIGRSVLGTVMVGTAKAVADTVFENSPHPAYAGDNPFRDRGHLRNACQHEIARQLRHSHAQFDHLDVTSGHLRNRTLQGDAAVNWHRSTHRMHYVCHFDRHGRVVDGQFYYYPERERMYAPVSLATNKAPEPKWRISDVASNDVLYVHDKASLASPRIGSLPYNATGVQVFGCIWSDIDQGTWCEVEYKGLRGFAARMYLKEDS